MPALKDRPDRPERGKSNQATPIEYSPYHNFTINELLDERNSLKKEGLDTLDVDNELRLKTRYYK